VSAGKDDDVDDYDYVDEGSRAAGRGYSSETKAEGPSGGGGARSRKGTG
jgi:hypothetical protein